MTELEIVEKELTLLRIHFHQSKEMYPTLLVVKEDRRFSVPANFQSSVQKDILSQGLKDMIKRSEPDYVVYYTESWIAPIRMKQDRLTPIARANDRMEILVVNIEFRSGPKFCRFAYVLRDGEGVKLTKFENLEFDITSGRFMDFFPVVKN